MNTTETPNATCTGGFVGCKNPATAPDGMCIGCREDGCADGCGLCDRPGGTGFDGYCSESCREAASLDDEAASSECLELEGRT